MAIMPFQVTPLYSPTFKKYAQWKKTRKWKSTSPTVSFKKWMLAIMSFEITHFAAQCLSFLSKQRENEHVPPETRSFLPISPDD